MKFPAFRKYSNNKSYFKILSATEFDEVVVLGRNYWLHHFTAKILPDHHLINDMLAMKDNRWETVSEKEYTDFLNNCQENFQEHT